MDQEQIHTVHGKQLPEIHEGAYSIIRNPLVYSKQPSTKPPSHLLYTKETLNM